MYPAVVWITPCGSHPAEVPHIALLTTVVLLHQPQYCWVVRNGHARSETMRGRWMLDVWDGCTFGLPVDPDV